jgi:hypothetical protein
MKKFIILFVLVVAATQIKAQVAPAKDITKILKFTNDNYDMGKTPFGKATEYNVGVTNISKDTVSLDNVQVACGCTTPKYTKGAKIAPGKSETIVLGFNGSTMGAFTKNVTLFFSEGLTKMVTFKGEGVQ